MGTFDMVKWTREYDAKMARREAREARWPGLPFDFGGDLRHHTTMGGYPLLYLTRKDEVLCPECADAALRTVELAEHEALTDPDEGPSEWELDAVPTISGANYETPYDCYECSATIEAAYDSDEETTYG